MSSDTTGEIWVIKQSEISTGTPVGGGGEPSGTGNAAPGGGRYGGIRRSVFVPGKARDGGATAIWGLGLTVLACLMTGLGILALMPVLEPAARRT